MRITVSSAPPPRAWFRFIHLIHCGLLAVALEAADTPRRPNVVFIVADDLRPDALACLGNRSIATPALDRLATRGVVFTRATCGYPICHVSRTEMLSGRTVLSAYGDAPVGGVLKFDPSWILWPMHFQRQGWKTIHSGKWHVAGTPAQAGFGETSGLFSSGGAPSGMKATLEKTPTGRTVTGYTGWTFKTSDQKPQPELGVGLTPQTDRRIADGAVAAIRAAGDQPFFLHVAFTAPHDPLHWPEGREGSRDFKSEELPRNFRPAPEFETGNTQGRDERVVPAPRTAEEVKRERAIYFSLVENLDRQVARILDALGETNVFAHTLVIFTSDHGLALGSHGLMGKQNQFEHTIDVPLIVAGPGVPAGRRIEAQCYLRDLYPTVCSLAAIATPASVQGRSLVPVLRGDATEVHEAIFGYFTDAQRMVRTPDGWKYIWYPAIGRGQLFHVPTDPDELRDRSAEPAQQARLDSLKLRLAQWQRDNHDRARLADASRPTR